MELKRTPIKEIIFKISFNEAIEMDFLGKFKNLSHISEKFPLIDRGFQTDIHHQEGQKPELTVLNDGYILKTTNNENKILQVRKGSFAFHKIKEYEKFDSLLQELKNYWLDFENCSNQKLSVNLVTVRYLNFIEKNQSESSRDLVTVYPKYPSFSDNVNGFVHLKFQHPEKNSINVNVVAADGKDDGIEGIILDIFLNRKLNNEQNSEIVFKHISELRDIKNEVFFKCVTEKMKKNYNQ